MAEWLRRLTRNQLGSPRVGSNPADCVFFLILFNLLWILLNVNICWIIHRSYADWCWLYIFRFLKTLFLYNILQLCRYRENIQHKISFNHSLLLEYKIFNSYLINIQWVKCKSSRGRVVKAIDEKSIGVSPRRFKSCRLRILFYFV